VVRVATKTSSGDGMVAAKSVVSCRVGTWI